MPRGTWSAKRERQYEHIKDSAAKRGKSTKRAKEIAAATVNKQRRRAGETATGQQTRRRRRHVQRKSRMKPVTRAGARQSGNARTRRRKESRR